MKNMKLKYLVWTALLMGFSNSQALAQQGKEKQDDKKEVGGSYSQSGMQRPDNKSAKPEVGELGQEGNNKKPKTKKNKSPGVKRADSTYEKTGTKAVKNGYGNHKGELEGKDFGKNRAEFAKAKNEVKKKELDETRAKGTDKVKEAKEKIEAAKINLDKEKSAGKLTNEEYKLKKEKIERAEQKTRELEEKLNSTSEKEE